VAGLTAAAGRTAGTGPLSTVEDRQVDLPSTRTLAFLFTDVEGSTSLWERFPDAMKGALRRHDAILSEAIAASAGQVVKSTGDGAMAVFGSAADAAAACLAAQRRLVAEPWPETGPLRVRMGVHCGQVEQRGGDFFGPTVNRTARIMAAGHGTQVLLSDAAAALSREALPPGADLKDLGEHRLKDLGRPEHLFQLVHPDLPAAFPPLVTVRVAGVDLPARATGLIGRQGELQEISERLADGSVRLLTLTGPGGTGKTMLALKTAEDLAPGFKDGVCFVDLSGARDTDAVLVAIARAVGLGEIIDRSLEEELLDGLHDRRMLILLDNFEQVTQAAAVVARLVAECPQVTVLATSREALHVRAERVFAVLPLSLPPAGRDGASASAIGGYEAVQLFVDRARAARPNFELTDENAAAVAEICRRLDGLPLAIELAAAHLRLFSPEVLRDRLGNRLGLLRSGPRDLPERQQTLRAAMDWSYELLRPGEQRLFELLAVFVDPEIGAVEAVTAGLDGAGGLGLDDGLQLDVLDGLAGLAEKSLVRLTEDPGAEPRVAMLETIREFAADQLDRQPDLAASARRAHAIHYADQARSLHADLTGGRREAALAALGADVANLRICWAHWVAARDLERLDQLAGPLLILDDAHGWYLDTVAQSRDMLAVLEAVPSSPERASQEIALRINLARALMVAKGFTPEVEAAFTGAVDLFESGVDVHQQYSVLRGLAGLYLFRAQLDEAGRLGREILALGEREGDPTMLIDGHLLVGTMLMTYDELAAGLDHLERGIAQFPALANRPRTARIGTDPRVSCLTTAGLTSWMLGYPDRALERANAALALAAQLEHPFTSAYAHFHAGLLRLWRNDPDAALDLAVGLRELAEEHEFRIWIAAGGVLLGAAQVDLGRSDEGLAAIQAGLGLYGELRSPPIFWPFLKFLEARASVRAGRPADALETLDSALEILGVGVGASVLGELYLLKGDLLASLPPVKGGGAAPASEWYQRAVDFAAGRGARMAHLRAATRLARLLQADGDPTGAAQLLEPVFATFTEGFETADLREARELLAALGEGA
jgi:predicted ATPase/class 3 adenylate cyclase